MVGFTLNCFQCFKIQAGAQLKPVFCGFIKFIKFELYGTFSCLLDTIEQRNQHWYDEYYTDKTDTFLDWFWSICQR